MDFILFAGGLAMVLLGANGLVNGASSIAKMLEVPDLVIGLTIVALGTSSPELVANYFSVMEGKPDLAIGNILGSNIANVLLILGITAIIYPVRVQSSTIWKEIPLSLLAAVALFVVANDQWLDGATESKISRTDGLVLLGFMVIFLVYTFEIAKKPGQETEDISIMPLWKSVLFVVAGLAGLFWGGKFFVEGASSMARSWGVSERVIGLTVVAIGTSLPELATSIIAAMQKKADIAIGNVVGSNIFNIFFILGTIASIRPLPFNAAQANQDVFVMIGASVALFVATRIFTRNQIGRTEGIIFAASYALYLLWLTI